VLNRGDEQLLNAVEFAIRCYDPCLSCAYLCPSGALDHTDDRVVRNFYRDLDFSQRMERFL